MEALLAQLPDNVKRAIVAKLAQQEGSDTFSCVGTTTHTKQDYDSITAQIRSRRLHVPSMQGGACILDGCLSGEDVQVRSAYTLLTDPPSAARHPMDWVMHPIRCSPLAFALIVGHDAAHTAYMPCTCHACNRLLGRPCRRGCHSTAAGQAWAASSVGVCGTTPACVVT